MSAYLFTSQNTRIDLPEYLLIGNDDSCHWNIPSASPRHAKIEYRNEQFVLKDLRSEKGTFLNDQRIQEAYLQEGDWIRIDQEERMFSLKAEKEKSTFSMKSRNSDWNQKLQRLGFAAKTDFSILILGPSGSGKEVVAQAIHKASPRSKGPIVCVNCSALSENLIESELFGHIKGSFTGALVDRKGAFESARGGTLFLDEIGDLSLSLQAKLLRALENDEIRPVGSDTTIHTDVRIIAATHQNLIEKIQNQEFRSDLYYRLNVVCIETPTLFDRPEDFEELLYCFAKQMKVRFSFSGIERMKKHSWPGNIRELENAIERAFVLETSGMITLESLPDTVRTKQELPTGQFSSTLDFHHQKEEFEKQFILSALRMFNGRINQTVAHAGIPKNTLLRKMRKFGINPKDFGSTDAELQEEQGE